MRKSGMSIGIENACVVRRESERKRGMGVAAFYTKWWTNVVRVTGGPTTSNETAPCIRCESPNFNPARSYPLISGDAFCSNFDPVDSLEIALESARPTRH
jgi:hypothetical protein